MRKSYYTKKTFSKESMVNIIINKTKLEAAEEYALITKLYDLSDDEFDELWAIHRKRRKPRSKR